MIIKGKIYANYILEVLDPYLRIRIRNFTKYGKYFFKADIDSMCCPIYFSCNISKPGFFYRRYKTLEDSQIRSCGFPRQNKSIQFKLCTQCKIYNQK